MRIAFYGSSLLSSYWNGAATYYRGLLSALHRRGHRITFYEPDAFDRQQHRDIEPPDWAEVRVYPATDAALRDGDRRGGAADVVIKASGVGVFDDALLEGVMAAAPPNAIRIFWDVDAPATLAELRGSPEHPLRRALPALDLVLTYGGGPPVSRPIEGFGARTLRADLQRARSGDPPSGARPSRASPPICLSSATGCPTGRRGSRRSSCAPPRMLPDRRFLIGGNGWDDKAMPPNVRRSAMSTRASTTPSTPRPRGAEHRPRQHGGDRLLPGDPRLRGGRRRRLPDHRCLGGHRAVPRPARRCWWRATGPRWPSISRALTPARARAIGEAARSAHPGRAHLCPARRAGGCAVARGAAAARRAA